MSSNPNIQNSFGPEVTAHEHLAQSAPQANPIDSPLHFVSYNERVAKDATAQSHPVAAAPESEKTPRKRILGLTVPIFWTVVAIIILAILGVAIGLGLGLGLKKSSDAPPANSPSTNPTTEEPANNTDKPDATGTTDPATETPSTTSSAPVTSGTVGMSANSCTFTSPKTYDSENGTPFVQFCFTDWPNGGDADDGSGEVTDLQRLTRYTFEDCMESCADYNSAISLGAPKCMAVTYNSNLTRIIAEGRQGGNCFLKDKKGVNQSGRVESASAAIAL
ncbi:uncharacterized protein DNG_07326 [Cephalotrichum gorgonifer]|uniref:PAN domain-containing protein n=1 Tax=Cephalotrichum gorgonifer TaxID=2041049 RepID=A0AAE8N1D4_9PEZI|nr:uncharacterized protein DNG_07326 [Cephalotrichum gorgonifer]